MHWTKCVATVIYAVLPFHAFSAQEKPGILEIFDQFLLTNAAVSKCAKPDNETLKHYLANFQLVSVYTSMELQKQYPNRTKDQIAEAMRLKSELVAKNVRSLVDAKGCNDAGIQELIKRFHAQAKWQPGKSASSEQTPK